MLLNATERFEVPLYQRESPQQDVHVRIFRRLSAADCQEVTDRWFADRELMQLKYEMAQKMLSRPICYSS